MVPVEKVSASLEGGLAEVGLLEEESIPEFELFGEFPRHTELKAHFHEIWGRLEDNLDLPLTSEEALALFPLLSVYDIPDGTRSTLTVRKDLQVGLDAAFYCLALVHTLKGLGAANCTIMTHTVYNRARGEEGLGRILRLLADGVKPFAEYARRHGVGIHLVGLKEDYELGGYLDRHLPIGQQSAFDAFFLVDYAEENFLSPKAMKRVEELPDIDVCIRHTKLNLSGGGWIPGKMLKATFMYSQNGSLYSNWTFDEMVAMATLALLAKLMHSGEGLVKMYGDIDEVKARHRLRELRLFNERIFLRPQPAKLFLFGSPQGLFQFYY